MAEIELEDSANASGVILAAYDRQRRHELRASVRLVVATVVSIVVAYAAANGASRPDDFSASLPFYAGQVGVMLALLCVPSRWFERHGQSIALIADVSFTIFLVGHLLVPSTTITGASTTICMKMLTSASFLSWRPSVQLVSSVASLLFYQWALSQRLADSGETIAAMVLPCLAGAAAFAATIAADRRRRDAFVKGVRLQRSEQSLRHTSDRLQREAFVKTALADAGRKLLACSDRATVLEEICRLNAHCLGAQFSDLWLQDATDRALVAEARTGYGDPAWTSIRRLRLTKQNARDLLQRIEDEGVVEVGADDTRHPLVRDLFAQHGMRDVLLVALRKGDEVFGCLAAGHVGPGPSFGPDERRIAEGIGQLASLALENARLLRDLEHANQLKQDFLATMSHELRTPLNAIIGYSALLQEGEMGTLPDDALDGIQRIRSNARRLLELVQATLDLNRLESGRLRLNLETVEADGLRREIDPAVAHLVRPGVQLRWEIPADLPPIHSDAAALRTILLNLTTNALKFTETGHVTIAATVVAGDVVFSVTDTGPGIPPELRPRIFEPYWQGSDRGEGLREGFGLGLYIVRQLSHAIGAEISVDATPDGGSVFRLRLPIQAEPTRPPLAA